jgi:hypothetical protein
MHHPLCRQVAVLLGIGLTLTAASGCGSSGSEAQRPTSTDTTPVEWPTDSSTGGERVIDPGDGGSYRPELDTTTMSDTIDNPYLPMPVGATWRYEGESDGVMEVVEIEVTDATKSVMGIEATVVRDTVTVGGALVEDTMDWFAQDADGNVWYLGEEVQDYEDGKVVSTAGSWEAGVNGALPGIVMPARPVSGDVFRQEYLEGEAEDMMEITGTDQTVTVASGTYGDVVETRDWSPLEPEVVEEKAYAPGVGKIREKKVAGGDGVAELVAFDLGR